MYVIGKSVIFRVLVDDPLGFETQVSPKGMQAESPVWSSDGSIVAYQAKKTGSKATGKSIILFLQEALLKDLPNLFVMLMKHHHLGILDYGKLHMRTFFPIILSRLSLKAILCVVFLSLSSSVAVGADDVKKVKRIVARLHLEMMQLKEKSSKLAG